MKGRSLEQKYSRICRDELRDEVFREFVALEREGTKAHNEYLPLAHSGRYMPHQSYVRLSRSYWIEVGCLDLFPGGPRYLNPKTLRRLMEYHERVQRTGIWSCSARSRSSSPRKGSAVVPPRQEGGAKVSNKRRDSAVETPSPPLLADPAAAKPSPNHESSVVQSDRQPKPRIPEPCRGKCLYSCIVRAPAVIPSEAPSPRLPSPKTLEIVMTAVQRLEFFLEQRYGAF